MVDPPTSMERELSRGEALRELSRAQRQLLAALAALESDDERERAAGAQALDHAESRVAHAMANLDRIATDSADEEGSEDAVGTDREGKGAEPIAAQPWFEPPEAVNRSRDDAPTPGARSTHALDAADVREYLGDLALLARQCAADVGDLRALLQAAAELDVRSDDEADASDSSAGRGAGVGTRQATTDPAPASDRSRRELLRSIAAELSQTTLDDLARSLAAMDERLDAAARAAPSPGPADRRRGLERLPEVDRLADARLSALEERLAAVERRLRWLEEVVRER